VAGLLSPFIPSGQNAIADRTQVRFSRFWNQQTGYCYDVLDGPDGDDPSLRPNQIFAVSLPSSPLTVSVVESKIFDGNAPMRPRGCIAQAWTVAEVLGAWLATENS
jgi:glycogen debranching enzyme